MPNGEDIQHDALYSLQQASKQLFKDREYNLYFTQGFSAADRNNLFDVLLANLRKVEGLE